MRIIALLIILISHLSALGKYPFARHPAIKTIKLPPKIIRNNDSILVQECTIGRLCIRITTQKLLNYESYIEILNKGKIEQQFDSLFITDLNFDSISFGDFNGDGISDIKLVVYYMGCGIAALNINVTYFFGTKLGRYITVSYDDKGGEHLIERDWNGDGNAEIMTMDLVGHGAHNYWCYNVYNFINGKMICVNKQYNYPILIQYLYKTNYGITKHMTRQQMKEYNKPQPDGLSITK